MNQFTEVEHLNDAVELLRAEKINAGKLFLHKSFLDQAWSELIMGAHRVGAQYSDVLSSLPRGTVIELSITGSRGIAWGNEPETRSIWLSVSLIFGTESRSFKVNLGLPSTEQFTELLSEQLSTLRKLGELRQNSE
jgi:hypothetical protein